jgi:O-antigen ligase
VRRRSKTTAISDLLGWVAMVTTLAITPQFSYDPINLPKLAVISIGGFMALGGLVANFKSLLDPRYRLIQIACLAFIFDLFVVLFLSGTNTAQEVFGTFGRSTGLVAYLSLCLLLITGVMAASSHVISRFAIFLLITGGLSMVYGIIQLLGDDPVKWNNPYSAVIGFLGNPNFQSSFVGLSGVLALSMLIDGNKKKTTRLGYLGYLALALFVISATDSQQGFLVLLGGSILVILIWISKSNLNAFTFPALASSLIGLVLVTLGSLNFGPLATLLYKDSVAFRGDYWRAGWEMSLQHPFFGVGLDSYGDWYRRTRSISATLRRGPEITSNASHNVFIDFSATGGFPLAAIYLLMMILVVVSAVRLLRRSKTFDPVVSGLIGVWVAYQAQSVISLNQLGLAVWGWIISGLIIGYEIKSRVDLPHDPVKKIDKRGKSASEFSKNRVAPNALVGMFTGLLIGLLVALPPLVSSVKFRSALASGDPGVVEQAAYIWPIEPFHMGQASGLLVGNKFEAQGLKVVTDAVEKFPDRFELWALLEKIPSATAEQKAEALVQMKRLDPNNPNLK